MRAGPLSKPEVIKLLNAYFVPVYAVNEDYRAVGPQPAEERREFTRIYREALDGKMSAGTVHVYLTSPDGKVIDSMHVAEVAHLGDHLILSRGFAHEPRFGDRVGQRLLKVDMFSKAHCHDAGGGVGVVGGAHGDSVDLVTHDTQ